MIQLGWPDLVIDLDHLDHEALLRPWNSVISGTLAARYMNRFGCWFIQRPEGHVELLDVFFGQVEQIASSFEEFESQMNDPAWQEVYLLSKQVFDLHLSGKVAAGTSCYAIVPPPLLGGPDPWASDRISPESVMVLDAVVLQGIYSQVFLQSCGHGAA